MKHIIASAQGVVAELVGHDADTRAQAAYNVIVAQLRNGRAVQVGDHLLLPGTGISIHEVIEVSPEHAEFAAQDHDADKEHERVVAWQAQNEEAQAADDTDPDADKAPDDADEAPNDPDADTAPDTDPHGGSAPDGGA